MVNTANELTLRIIDGGPVADGEDTGEVTAAPEPLAHLYESGCLREEGFGTIVEGETLEQALEREGFFSTPTHTLRPGAGASVVTYAVYQRRECRPREFLVAMVLDGDRVGMLPDLAYLPDIDSYRQFCRDGCLEPVEQRDGRRRKSANG